MTRTSKPLPGTVANHSAIFPQPFFPPRVHQGDEPQNRLNPKSNKQEYTTTMKTTYVIALSAILGSFALAQDAPQRPARGPGGPGAQRPLPAEMLKKFDKDGDGKLSDDERKAMREEMAAAREKAMLEQLDTDKDGKVSDEERKAGEAKRKAAFEARQKEMLEKYDADKDGKLSQEEMKTAGEARRKEMMEKYDTDKDGKLSPEEMKAMRDANPGMGMPGGRGERPGGRPGGRGNRPGGPPPAPATPAE
jgi:Ca2+-binding EF-hand superfamily protein